MDGCSHTQIARFRCRCSCQRFRSAVPEQIPARARRADAPRVRVQGGTRGTNFSTHQATDKPCARSPRTWPCGSRPTIAPALQSSSQPLVYRKLRGTSSWFGAGGGASREPGATFARSIHETLDKLVPVSIACTGLARKHQRAQRTQV